MSIKRFCLGLAAMLAMAAPTAFAHQNGPSVPNALTVAKAASNLGDYSAQFTSIQAAVNAAKEGQVIEILDEAEYPEQVTIEGRADRRWPTPSGTGQIAPLGGKNWITIKYTPPSASATARPSIKYRDTDNQGPEDPTYAQNQGDSVRSSGNFETNGALRIIRAEGITIEGIIVDGGGAAPFYNSGVWVDPKAQKAYGLLHGNAAIAVAVSGNVQIRDCELRNAFFGIAVKDRNTGGVFGSPNPSDNDNTIPLSGFGKNGYHLFEYNKIHSNSIGIFFESSWDRGSTVRYNLIYGNYHQSSATAALASDKDDTKAAGALSFKDNYLSPVAIYNNTFHDNAGNLVGAWQIGYQYLIFNNIFSKTHAPVTGPPYDIQRKFPNRMKHNIFGGASQVQLWNQQKDIWCAEYRDRVYVEQVQFQPSMGELRKVADTVVFCTNYGTPAREVRVLQVIKPGSVLPGEGGQNGNPFAANSNNKWLEMGGTTGGLPVLFKSTTTTSADFLAPDWDKPDVMAHIRNGGWPDAGISNEDGTIADIGAIPFSGKRPGDGRAQKLRARVSPFSVVEISGTTATVSLAVTQEVGQTGALTIKYLRWVAPIPNNKDSWGDDGVVLSSGSIRTIAGAEGRAITGDASTMTFTVPALSGSDSTGFFEVVLQGPNGTTDVGFLPYRKLDYILKVEVLNSSGAVVANPSVTAGEPVTLRVSAWKRGSGGAADTRYTTGAGSVPLQVDYNLTLPAAKMWNDANQGTALQYEPNLTNPMGTAYEKTYTVYFTKAGSEIVRAAGLWVQGENRLPFLGNLQLTVKPGAPSQVVFIAPIPKSQLGNNTPATIVGTYPVEVEVQDRYGNAVDQRVTVSMASLQPTIGSVESPTAATDPATGKANFTAIITNGVTNDRFDLAASSGSLKPDTGSLRVGRAADGFRVFYYESTPPKHGTSWIDDYEEKTEIDELVGVRVPVWVKVRSNMGDTILTTRSGFACVASSDPGVLFSGTESGAAAAGQYLATVTDGVAKFWITSEGVVDNASLSVSARASADCGSAEDKSITNGNRGSITFTKPAGGVGTAFVKGDRYGRPNYVEITFTGSGAGGFNTEPETWKKPDRVTLSWSGACAGAVVVSSTTFDYKPDGFTVGVTFDPAEFPEGYTNPPSVGVVTIYGAIDLDVPERSPSSLIDSIGPLIARSRPALCGHEALGNPRFEENKSPGVTPYVLKIQISEPLGNDDALIGESIMLSVDSLGTDPTRLTVAAVSNEGGIYSLTLSPTSLLEENYWIRFNPAISAITDNFGVRVHENNRWVQIRMEEAPAAISNAWYTADDKTGEVDYIYVTFDKSLTAAYIPEWFLGGSFSFKWGENVATFGVTAENITSISSVSPANTIRINVKQALTDAQFNTWTGGVRIRTGDPITVTAAFGAGKGWSERPEKIADDKARPVLVSAELRIGAANDNDEFEPDTLVLTFSERTLGDLSTITAPVSISCGTCAGFEPVIVRAPPLSSIQVGVHSEVKYLVESIKTPAGGDPKDGDMVRINYLAGLADGSGNLQDSVDNRQVPLKIIPGKPNWKTKVKNNPFRGSGFVIVETTPNAKGNVLKVEAQIKLYDSMGKLVWEGKEENDPAQGNAVEWKWEGRNRNGRVVGTGTYLFKAVYTAKNESGNYVDPQIVNRSIGFVRGKQ